MLLPVAVKPMLERVRNFVLLAGWLQQQFEQPNHWSLDSFSCGTYGLNGAVAQHHSSATARYCNTAQLHTHRIEVFCRFSVAAVRHHRLTALRCLNITMLSLHDASALYIFAVTASRRRGVLGSYHSGAVAFHHCNIAQLRIRDAVAFRRLSAVTL